MTMQQHVIFILYNTFRWLHGSRRKSNLETAPSDTIKYFNDEQKIAINDLAVILTHYTESHCTVGAAMNCLSQGNVLSDCKIPSNSLKK